MLLTSCGYRGVGVNGEPLALSIPLIWQDEDGRLRDHLARNLASTGCFEYISNSRYQLIVKLEEDFSEDIGYVWDQEPLTGERIKRLYPSESQRTISAKVFICDTCSEKNLIEPFVISVQGEYDFVNPTAITNIQFTDVNGQTQSVLQYSLGQLDSEEGARIGSSIPLHKILASKIVEALTRIPLKI